MFGSCEPVMRRFSCEEMGAVPAPLAGLSGSENAPLRLLETETHAAQSKVSRAGDSA